MAQRIGLALSGGGSRAVAFHLGCLRALHSQGLLTRIEVLSTVSGGSVIGALFATHHGDFAAFEEATRTFLRKGLVRPGLHKALTSTEGIKAVAASAILGTLALMRGVLSWLAWGVSFALPPEGRERLRQLSFAPAIPRWASRTTILRRVLDDEIFAGRTLRELASLPFNIILVAADLRTGSAFYFSPKQSGSWRMGELAGNNVSLAHAVMASAAHPMFLPSLDEHLPFNRTDGSRRVERVVLTDGGVYDNTGLAPLWPDRDVRYSLNAKPLDTIICCRAGYGLRLDPPVQFFTSRLMSSFHCVHGRSENAAVKRLYDLRESGKIKKFIMPFLGQDDSRLAHAPDDLVTREESYGYPTDFSAMPEEWIEKLSRRGEQLTKALIKQHEPI